MEPTYLEPTNKSGRALFMRGVRGPIVIRHLFMFREVADYSRMLDIASPKAVSGRIAYETDL